MSHQLRLQCESHDGRAENQHAVQRVPLRIGMPQRIEKTNRHVDRKERNQERLHSGVVLRRVLESAPCGSHAEGGQEAEQIEHAPRAQPGDDGNGYVQQQVVAEQRDVTALAGRQQDRRGEGTGEADQRQGLRVRQQRQQGGQRADQRHQRECGQRRNHRVHFVCCKHGEIKHRHARALQQQAVVRACRIACVAGAASICTRKTKALNQQHDANQTNRCEARLGREEGIIRRPFCKKRQADEQHYGADARDRVAAEQPGLGAGDERLDHVGRGGHNWSGRSRGKRRGEWRMITE